MALYDYLGNSIESATANVKVPQIFNAVLNTELVYTATVTGDLQSCCANGRYVYYADITNKTINRYDTISGTLTSQSQPTIGHANGMTYCPRDNCIYVATETTTNILKINADTLVLEDTIPVWHSDPQYSTDWKYTAISYNRNLDVFYLKSAKIFHVYDYNLNYIDRMELENFPENATTQSIETDGTFIYLCWLEGTSYYTASAQHINIYTLDGKFLKDVKPYFGEIESIAYNGYGDYYLSFCKGASNYGIIRKVFNPLSADTPTANGTYSLKATVSNGIASFSWVSI